VIAGDDITANLNSALFTGTQLDIAAIDHITPIATTPASPIHVPVRICIPSVCVSPPLRHPRTTHPHIRRSCRRAAPHRCCIVGLADKVAEVEDATSHRIQLAIR
jgi:hypothetical protein